MRLDSLTAEEALRRARATSLRFATPDNIGDMAGTDFGEIWSSVVDGHFLTTGGVGDEDSWYQRAASALLDGFSVDEVTEAGG